MTDTVEVTHGEWPGQVFQIHLSIDDGYMFTARQTVANGAADWRLSA